MSVDGLQRFLSRELAYFERHVDENPVPEVQDLRGLAIAWMGTLLPEVFLARFVKRLECLVERLRGREDYLYTGWYRLLPLDVALFAVTGDRACLVPVITNLDHHKMTLRNFNMDCFALIANRVTFDREMLDRTANNLRVAHARCEDLVTLFAVSNQAPREKIDQISKWLAQSTPPNSIERETLRRLAAGEFVVNPFLSWFLWIQQYLWLRSVSDSPNLSRGPIEPAEGASEQQRQELPPSLSWVTASQELAAAPKRDDVRVSSYAPDQIPMFGSPADQIPMFGPSERFDGQLPWEPVWKRIRGHPLMESHIRIEVPNRIVGV